MTNQPILQTEYAINGSFGELLTGDGEWLTEVQSVQATIRIGRRDIMRAGTRSVGYKPMTVSGEGTIGLMKVTSKFLQVVSEMMRGGNQQMQKITTLTIRLNDPEALGVEQVRLTKVRFWEVNFGFGVDEIIEESIPFTFENIEGVSWITGNPSDPNARNRQYTALD